MVLSVFYNGRLKLPALRWTRGLYMIAACKILAMTTAEGFFVFCFFSNNYYFFSMQYSSKCWTYSPFHVLWSNWLYLLLTYTWISRLTYYLFCHLNDKSCTKYYLSITFLCIFFSLKSALSSADLKEKFHSQKSVPCTHFLHVLWLVFHGLYLQNNQREKWSPLQEV